MTPTTPVNPTIDRLYQLLPAIYRLREAEAAQALNLGEAGYYLRDLLRVIAEQVNAVEDNIAQLYDDWFIETASSWAVPYLADLVGYSAPSSGEDTILVPRRDVADTIRYRRRRGTVSVLSDLAVAVAGWPALPVEFFKLLGWTQNLDHQYSKGERARIMSLHDANVLDKLCTPFDPFAYSVDVRRISNPVSTGRYNIPSLGLYVWRLKPYSVTYAPGNCLDAGKNAYTFSVLGNDGPLFTSPSEHGDEELRLPVPILRRAFDAAKDDYYGAGKSLEIWADWSKYSFASPVPSSAITVADLSGWTYAPPDDHIAVDPVLGRIAFPHNQLPRRHVRVSYYYGFSADLGGGEYERTLSQESGSVFYTVGESGTYKRISEAVDAWKKANPENAVIEVTDSAAYVEQIDITVGEDQTLQLRAANGARPVLRLLDWQTDLPDALSVHLSSGSGFTLDGFLVTGRGISVTGVDAPAAPALKTNDRTNNPRNEFCPSLLTIRHCTLVPGWNLDCDCEPMSPNKESLEIQNLRARVAISDSIIGPIIVQEDEVQTDPIPIDMTRCIIDAMGGDREAIAGPSGGDAHAVLSFHECTVFGIVQANAIQLAENSIFNDCVHVIRRQIGCMRFCYVPSKCRTPQRFDCQPDMVATAERARLSGKPEAEIEAGVRREAFRVRPQYTARRYGTPAYCQLSVYCATEISAGADDASEMGVFHDLLQPQRLASLSSRLDDFTPAAMTSGVLLSN